MNFKIQEIQGVVTSCGTPFELHDDTESSFIKFAMPPYRKFLTAFIVGYFLWAVQGLLMVVAVNSLICLANWVAKSRVMSLLGLLIIGTWAFNFLDMNQHGAVAVKICALLIVFCGWYFTRSTAQNLVETSNMIGAVYFIVDLINDVTFMWDILGSLRDLMMLVWCASSIAAIAQVMWKRDLKMSELMGKDLGPMWVVFFGCMYGGYWIIILVVYTIFMFIELISLF